MIDELKTKIGIWPSVFMNIQISVCTKNFYYLDSYMVSQQV